MILTIKNMVCPRCIESVETVAKDLRLPVESVELGKVILSYKPRDVQLSAFSDKLSDKGFEVIFDRETEIIVSVKSALISYLDHLQKSENPEKISSFLTKKLNYNYSYLSKLFSSHEGITIETYFIKLKVEKVKELLNYNKWTLSEIAWKLKYSSVQYLSNQFKKVTGQTVTEYLDQKENRRISIDQL